MTIRNITINDIPDLAQIEQEVFPNPWDEIHLTALLSKPFLSFVAEEDEKCIGYLSCFLSSYDAQILNIGVRKAHQHKGVATALFEALFQELKQLEISEISLEVRTTNQKAVSLYQKLGFSIVGTRKHFYKNPPDDAYVMVYYKEV